MRPSRGARPRGPGPTGPWMSSLTARNHEENPAVPTIAVSGQQAAEIGRVADRYGANELIRARPDGAVIDLSR